MRDALRRQRCHFGGNGLRHLRVAHRAVAQPRRDRIVKRDALLAGAAMHVTGITTRILAYDLRPAWGEDPPEGIFDTTYRDYRLAETDSRVIIP